jgi:crotonobetainyl-CoA:carnitine CoA-transferase CaiB-like acyl-CoA transferase
MAKKRQMLEGIRILDLTSVVMGPFATRILADLGADVIKIESPEGDSTRAYAPHGAPGISGIFLNLNRNKRGIVLDLKTPEGKNTLERMLATADVFVHSLRAPVIRRLGFDYDACRRFKPSLVYCSAFGFGAEGPYSAKPAYDDMIQAGSGYAALSIPLTGEASYAPSVICDKLAGQAVANAILAGLFHRERTGEGQAIEVPMFETAIDFHLVENFSAAAWSPPRGRPGHSRLQSRNRRPFRTADGYACILPYSDGNWRDFFRFIGRDDLANDARFATLGARAEYFDFLYGIIAEVAPSHSTQEWIMFCDPVNIPCMPVIDLADIDEDVHVKAVKLFETVDHPHAGPYKSIRRTTRFGASDFEVRYHAPLLGEHTQEILAEFSQR